ncbi:YhcN/YlaJ family sporulation lipoprotein [Salipaludibacillus daqingensis]|uniref:YhcN/YlaJ family sporulation lipoprotein n=1 Tax=Salipaludibacillus daqingensis TaxID=3041001 RepID=UPI00247369DF|nr:YhcN/YlaJ family sporulation lipoprotein [Salipaludibacillus daqingensis]
MKNKSKISVLLTLLVLSLTIPACGEVDNTGGQGQGFDFMRGYGRDDQSHAINKKEVADPRPFTQYGFQRHTKRSVAQGGGIPGYSVYDRSLLAESISEMAAVLQDVNDVGVLVTDQHVLIAYDSPSPDREAVADQVKQTAMSVIPAYYDVYVADDITLMDEIERFKGRSSKEQSQIGALHQTIEQMKEYPQGASEDEKGNPNKPSTNMNNN